MAALYDCHRNTVRSWFRLGLEPVDEKRPALVKGDVLNAFHASRRAAGKRPCGPAEIYCAPCHKPQRPAGDLVEIEPLNAKVWKVSGICPDCNRMMSQRVGVARLTHFRALDQLSVSKLPARISERCSSGRSLLRASRTFPHSFRKTVTRLGMELPLSDAARKARSQNLGHDDVMVTMRSYGELPRHQQHELIKAAAHAKEDDALALQLGREMLASMRAKKVG